MSYIFSQVLLYFLLIRACPLVGVFLVRFLIRVAARSVHVGMTFFSSFDKKPVHAYETNSSLFSLFLLHSLTCLTKIHQKSMALFGKQLFGLVFRFLA